MLGPCFVLLYFLSIISLGKRELNALLLLGSECHVMGRSEDCDCSISWSYALTFCSRAQYLMYVKGKRKGNRIA